MVRPLCRTVISSLLAMLTDVEQRALRRKVALRIMPLIILMYFAAYLGFSDAVYGFGIGIFFLGYLTLEIPGALLVERWSARKWFARILITWGFISAATAFVTTPNEFCFARFLLGVAEAGFFPGVVVYFTHWFPSQERARAMSGLVLAIPISLAIGAPLSAQLLDVGWYGLRGWQWLFIVEGLPAVALGIVTLFALTDRPRHAAWLTPAERDHLEGALAAENAAKEATGKVRWVDALRMSNVWLLALGIFATNMGGYALSFWLPTTVKSISGGSDKAALLYSGLFYLCGLAGVIYNGYSSDRSGDRKWHCVAGQAATGVLLAASTIPGQPFALVMLWLLLTGLVAHSWPPPFWALPTLSLTASAAAASIGFINIFANLAGYLGNHIFGFLRSRGMTDGMGLLLLAGCYLLGALIVSRVRVPAEAAVRRAATTTTTG